MHTLLYASYSPSAKELGGLCTETILLKKVTPETTDSEIEGAGSPCGQDGSGGSGHKSSFEGSSGAGNSGGLGGSSEEHTKDVVFMKVTLPLCIIYIFEV